MNNFFKYPSGSSGSMELDYDEIILTLIELGEFMELELNAAGLCFYIPSKNDESTGIFKIGAALISDNNTLSLILPKLSLERDIELPMQSIVEYLSDQPLSAQLASIKYVIYDEENPISAYISDNDKLLGDLKEPIVSIGLPGVFLRNNEVVVYQSGEPHIES